MSREGVPTLYGRGGVCQGRGFPHYMVEVGVVVEGVPTLYGRGGGCQGRGFPHYMVEVGVAKAGGSHIIW